MNHKVKVGQNYQERFWWTNNDAEYGTVDCKECKYECQPWLAYNFKKAPAASSQELVPSS